jgi:hypothetical protein
MALFRGTNANPLLRRPALTAKSERVLRQCVSARTSTCITHYPYGLLGAEPGNATSAFAHDGGWSNKAGVSSSSSPVTFNSTAHMARSIISLWRPTQEGKAHAGTWMSEVREAILLSASSLSSQCNYVLLHFFYCHC